MKRFIPILACGFAVLLTAGLCVTAIRQAHGQCDGCTSTCGTSDFVQWGPSSNSTSDTAGAFSSSWCFTWVYQSPPTLGDIAFRVTGSVNIDHDPDDPAYDPEYLTNPDECCQGDITVGVTGMLEPMQTSGTLKTLGWFWPPYREAIQTLTIN